MTTDLVPMTWLGLAKNVAWYHGVELSDADADYVLWDSTGSPVQKAGMLPCSARGLLREGGCIVTIELCPCGQPLHYVKPESEAIVRRLIALFGETTVVVTPDGSWRVPRHFIALHGIRAREVPVLAVTYKWERIDNAN